MKLPEVLLFVGCSLGTYGSRHDVRHSDAHRRAIGDEPPRDCMDILHYGGQEESGLYHITLWRTKQVVEVYCDMVTDGGGWTVFQRRFTGALDFNRPFAEYESGFGSLSGEYWLGLKYIQELASISESELRLDVVAKDGTDLYESFHNFSLSPSPNYRLYLELGHGSIGDDRQHGLSYAYGQAFSTSDHDVSEGHCTHYQKSGWWYLHCGYINLNAHHDMKMFYTTSHGYESLKETQMMLRRSDILDIVG